MSNYKVSVIVPVYKVQHFIERCAMSLFSQTLQAVEYIFVNDATPDDSVDILRRVISSYPQRKVTILEHEHNKGLPAARNTGLAVASGEYVFHCDSDDYVEPDMLQVLYDKAKQCNADMVWCDWFLRFTQNERYMKEPSYATSYDALCGILSGNMKYNVWNKLARRSLYEDNQISFPAGHAMGEDMTMIRLLGSAKIVAYVPCAYYHYVRTNANAYTQTVNTKMLQDLRFNVEETMRFLEKRFPDSLQKEKNYFKLNVKLPFLITSETKQYQLWEEWYPEANEYILSNKNQKLYTRILQWMAWHKQFWFVRLYYCIFIKFRYGVIYK